MAFLKQPKTEDDLKKLTIGKFKTAYRELASDYGKILNLDYIYCPMCGEWLSSVNFYSSRGTTSGINHVGCKKCLLRAATDYDKKTNTYSDNRDKTIEVLRKLDMPFYDNVYKSAIESIRTSVSEKNRRTAFQQYIVIVSSFPQYVGKTFKDSDFGEVEGEYNNAFSNKKPRREIIKMFGQGFSNEDYLYLQDQYDDWRSRVQIDSKSQETYLVRICFKLLDLYKAQKSGKDTEKLDKSLNDLLLAANLQPRQNVGNASTDSLTFGQLIEKWELEEPIPEPDEQFKDVDGIAKYIDVFFKGHLAKMMGLKNGYSHQYDKYMEKYTVSKPEYDEGEGSEAIFDAIFGKEVE